MGARALFAGVHVAAALVLVASLSLPAVGRAGEAVPAQGSSDTTVAAQNATEEIGLALKDLERLRAGDDTVLPQLRARTVRCAEIYGRPDIGVFVEFFARLPAADRVRGLELEAQFAAVRADVRRLGIQAVGTAAWRTNRPAILNRLEEIIAQGRPAPDFTPAARALSLRATIRRQRAVEDSEFDESSKHEWIRLGRLDAEESIEMFERAGMRLPQLEPRLSVAWLDWASADWSSARDGFEDVLGLARYVARTEFQQLALNGLLQVAEQSGDLQETSRLLDELARLQSPSVSWDLARGQAQLLLAIDEPSRAAEFLSQRKPKGERDLRDWHVLMAGVLARKGDAEAALAHERALRAEPRASVHSDRALVDLALADIDLRRGHALEVLEAIDTAQWDDAAPARLRADRERIRGGALLALGRAAEASAALERALAIGDSIEAKLATTEPNTSTSSVVGETIGLESVALLARAKLEMGDALGAALAIEEHQTRALRAAIAGGTSPALTLEALRAWSKAYECGFVTWVIGGETSVVVHVMRGGDARGAVLKFGRKQLEEAVRRLREATIANDDEVVAEFAAEIQGQILPAEILARISTRGSPGDSRVLVCAHGPLERMPLDVLPLFADVARPTLIPVVLPGLLELTPGVEPEPTSRLEWTLVGDPVDAAGASILPGVHAELMEIAALHPGARQQIGTAFDRGAVAAALASGRALHIATHVVIGPVRMSSIDARLSNAGFLLSSGERFDIVDIARAHPRLPLAVLAACETGGGQFVDAEASIGVARAFLETGTRNLLVTSWPVEDGAARRFALAFHRALRDGERPSRAAVSARQALRAAGASTADWAAFRLLGRD